MAEQAVIPELDDRISRAVIHLDQALVYLLDEFNTAGTAGTAGLRASGIASVKTAQLILREGAPR